MHIPIPSKLLTLPSIPLSGIPQETVRRLTKGTQSHAIPSFAAMGKSISFNILPSLFQVIFQAGTCEEFLDSFYYCTYSMFQTNNSTQHSFGKKMMEAV